MKGRRWAQKWRSIRGPSAESYSGGEIGKRSSKSIDWCALHIQTPWLTYCLLIAPRSEPPQVLDTVNPRGLIKRQRGAIFLKYLTQRYGVIINVQLWQLVLTRPFFQICTKSQWGLFWAETRPPYKFHGNPFSSFCVILVTNQQTNK